MSTTSVKGILVDSATGAPVADAYIMITGGDEHPDIASQSGDDGSFFLEGVHVPGTYTLQIRRGDSSKTVTVNVDNKGKVLSIPF